MTRDEFKVIIKGLKGAYTDPKFIPDQNAFDVWYALMNDIDYEIASMAVQKYMQSEKFPPAISDIRKYAAEIVSPKTDDMSELEAWSLVRKALSNGLYGAQEEFERLPPLIRQVLGNPERLKEMAQLEVSEVETVEQSHFVRSYRARLESHKQNMRLNESLKLSIDRIRESNTPQIDVKHEDLVPIEVKGMDKPDIPDDVIAELEKLYSQVGLPS